MGEFQNKKMPDDLVNEGWTEMRHLLDLHSPVKAKPSRRFFVWGAATVMLLFIVSSAVFLYRPFATSEKIVSHDVPSIALELPVQPIDEKAGSLNKKNVDSGKKSISALTADAGRKPEMKDQVFLKDVRQGGVETGLRKFEFAGGIHIDFPTASYGNSHRSVSAKPDSIYLAESAEHPEDKRDKVHRIKTSFYAGGAVNFSGKKSISFETRSVHPVAGMQFHLNNRVYLDLGVGLLSAISRKQHIPIGKEYVNNRADDVYYRRYTTDVVRVHYLDIPVTLNYRVTNSFSVGGGMEISRLYKSRIFEKKETYNFNEEITAAEQNTFMSSSSNVGSFPRLVEVSGWDPRYLVQVGWSQRRWGIMGKYHSGLRTAVKILQNNTVMHEYDNTFISLELRYHFSSK